MIRLHFADGSEKTYENCTRLPTSFNSEVIRVDASGNELGAIRNHFINLPDYLHKNSMSWFGDWAKFIAQNYW
jgi:hypothetical protein